MIRSYIIYADNVPANLVKAQQPADAVKAVAAKYLNGEKITAVDAMIAPLGDVQRLCAIAQFEFELAQLQALQQATRPILDPHGRLHA